MQHFWLFHVIKRETYLKSYLKLYLKITMNSLFDSNKVGTLNKKHYSSIIIKLLHAINQDTPYKAQDSTLS